MKKITRLSLLLLTLLAAQALFAAPRPDDADALRGVDKGKVLFDINMTDAKKMTLYLAVIRETVDDLRRQGVEPDVILAFPGLSVRLISKDRGQMDLTDFEHLDRIAEQLAGLQDQGVRMEACSWPPGCSRSTTAPCSTVSSRLAIPLIGRLWLCQADPPVPVGSLPLCVAKAENPAEGAYSGAGQHGAADSLQATDMQKWLLANID